jgi:hypothetical protein
LIGHLDVPAALLTNETPTNGNYVAVHLRSTVGARDAVGATARVVTNGRTLVRQLTAGDGYQASNERRLVFGLGTDARIDKLTVQWPSGHLQSFPDVPSNSELLLVEQRDTHTVLHPHSK